jgi:hypothetical protein
MQLSIPVNLDLTLWPLKSNSFMTFYGLNARGNCIEDAWPNAVHAWRNVKYKQKRITLISPISEQPVRVWASFYGL